jgi:hypothetical protein
MPTPHGLDPYVHHPPLSPATTPRRGAFSLREAAMIAGAQISGYLIGLVFFVLGSATYMCLLFRLRYVPMAITVLGFVGSALVVLVMVARMLFPALAATASVAILALPTVVRAFLALTFVPILGLEVILGLWLLVKGVRVSEQT